jgi:protein involved in polysaccharide export with SLBB domain
MKRYFFLFYLIVCSHSVWAQQLNPGDGLRLTFYNISDEISGDYFVQQDGKIQLPFIGLVDVLSDSFAVIQTKVKAKYDSIYRDPELTVQPLYRINVLGEVRTPGIYYVTGVEKLTDLIAMAGGETSDSDLDDIYVIRDDQKIYIDAERIIEEGDKVSDIGLRSGDKIYVSRSWWGGASNTGIVIAAAGVVVALIGVLAR